MLSYAIVIATRNRHDALRASIPLMLKQSRKPARVCIVDRSDDHDAIVSLVKDISETTDIPVSVQWGEAANLPLQRNQGITGIEEPVTMLPDDDSFWFPETAARIMAVYEADADAKIGGVSGLISSTSPMAKGTAPRNARRFVRRKGIESLRNRVEEHFAPQPFNLYARTQIEALAPAARADGLTDTTFIETMSGWRMSYRTEVVQSLGYDATLGSRVGYGQHEDKDMSLRAQRAGWLLAAAPGAEVFHNVAPGKRAGGFAYGFFWLFNYAYICRKVFGDAAPGRAAVARYCGYKAFLYRLRRGSEHERDIARGAAAAMQEFDTIWQAADEDLQAVYGTTADRVLGR